jgi:diguanylate cyclase (GGDEF)-like protein
MSVSASSILYASSGLPLLLAISNTRNTASTRTAFLLDLTLSVIILTLLWVRLFAMRLDSVQAVKTLVGFYVGEGALIALAAVIRMLIWNTYEERRRIRLFAIVIWIYLPVEVGMILGTELWHLQTGTIFDALWSLPFFYAGWQSLHLPFSHTNSTQHRQLTRAGLFLDSLSPLFVTSAAFCLAISVVGQHPVLALTALGAIVLLQSLHAALAQLNVYDGQALLLERERQLREANYNLERLSMEDPLTGVANRRRFDAALNEAWRRAARRRDDFAILMIDLDHFKAINDLHGHAYGDECLIEVTDVLEQQAHRSDDLLARYGGEEFVFMLPVTDLQGAKIVADRLRVAVWSRKIRHEGSPFAQRLTVSVGIGIGKAEPGVDPALLVIAADQALYEAKRLGRNRTCIQALGAPGAAC